MTSENFSHLAQDHRLSKERKQFIGCRCPDCGTFYFTSRGICTNSECKAEILERPVGRGRITAILEPTESGERFVEFTYENDKQRRITLCANGLSHSAKLVLDVPAVLFSRKSSKQETPVLSLKLTSSSK